MLHAMASDWLAWAVLSAVLSAEPPQTPGAELQLSWDAPPGCPDAEVVRGHAQARLEGRGRSTVAEARVRGSDEEGWHLELSVQGPAGVDRREVTAASCEELAEAAGLFIAVAAEPGAEDGEEASEPHADVEAPEVPPPQPASEDVEPVPDEPIPVAAPTSMPPPSDPAPVDPAPTRRIRAAVRVEGIAQLFRLLPRSASGGVGGAVALWPGVPRVRLEARAHYFFAQRAMYPAQPVGADFDLWLAAAAACFEPRWDRVSLPVCGGVEAGGMRGRGVGVADPGPGTAAFVGLPVDVAVTWAPTRWLALWLGPRATVSLRRPPFHVRGLDTLFRAGPGALRLVAGVEVRFP